MLCDPAYAVDASRGTRCVHNVSTVLSATMSERGVATHNGTTFRGACVDEPRLAPKGGSQVTQVLCRFFHFAKTSPVIRRGW